MEELNLSTPALLFSAVSLILLAYTNRFLSYAQLVRTLKEQYVQKHSEVTRIRHSTAVAYSITRYFNLGDTHIRKGA